MRCRNCHYSLDNLAEHRCPECGTEFDPSDADTIDDPNRRRFMPPVTILGLAIISLMVAELGSFMMFHGGGYPLNTLGVALALAVGICPLWPVAFMILSTLYKVVFHGWRSL